jgi:hypothetical protein
MMMQGLLNETKPINGRGVSNVALGRIQSPDCAKGQKESVNNANSDDQSMTENLGGLVEFSPCPFRAHLPP